MRRTTVLDDILGTTKPIIGMVHSLPLPGSPRYRPGDLERASHFAVEEALRWAEGGIDGLLLENAGDVPFVREPDIGYETVAAMTAIATRIREATQLPLGIITVANAANASLAIAQASGARFIRVNQWANAYVANEGLVEGVAGRALRYRSWIGAHDVAVFADVHVKHGSHAITADRSVAEQAVDAAFFDADVLIATGTRTGEETTLEEVREVAALVDHPVIVGSGLKASNCRTLLAEADGAIIGSAVKTNRRMHGGSVDVSKVRALMEIVAEIRASAEHASRTTT